MQTIVIDRTADGNYVAFDQFGVAGATFSPAELGVGSFDAFDVFHTYDGFQTLVASIRAALDEACAIVAIDPAIRCGAPYRQHISSASPCAVVGFGALLVEQVPESVQRFAFAAADGRRLFLITVGDARTITHVAEAAFERLTERELAVAAALGYEFVLCDSRLGDELAARTTPLSRARLRNDARTIAQRNEPSAGVWVARSDAGTTLTMTLEERITFDVLQSSAPIFDLGNDALRRALGGRRPIFFIDETVDALYGARLRDYARVHLRNPTIETVRAVESEKTLDHARAICRSALRDSLPRDGVFVAVGGGVTLDLVGTAAALHRRGSAFLRVPTTLVGMVDVCVGVKQGVNDGQHKNVLGAYHAPLGGLNDTRFLETLPRGEIAAGIAEIIKVALVLDAELFALLEGHVDAFFRRPFEETNELLDIVIRAKYAMMRELQKNLWEHDLQRLVDFGHTFSSAIETESDYAISHGLAVGLDMLISTALATAAGSCRPSLLPRLIALYRRAGLPVTHETCTIDVLLKAIPDMRLHRAGNLNLVLPTAVGAATFRQHVTRAELEAALDLVGSAACEPALS